MLPRPTVSCSAASWRAAPSRRSLSAPFRSPVYGSLRWRRVPGGDRAGLSNHSVDAVLTGEVLTGEEKLEVQPTAEPDDHWVRNITESSGVPIGQQLAVLVHSVDA